MSHDIEDVEHAIREPVADDGGIPAAAGRRAGGPVHRRPSDRRARRGRPFTAGLDARRDGLVEYRRMGARVATPLASS
jgi:hypothetical protein